LPASLLRLDNRSRLHAQASRQIDFWLRDTFCPKRHGDRWRIVHMHSSVPFYMDGSLRPAFDLAP
jgi:ketosteroid isomerase-like protein